ncbi:Endoplasmic reticulum membrane-associated RNA degradation protein, partial [Taenia solium]
SSGSIFRPDSFLSPLAKDLFHVCRGDEILSLNDRNCPCVTCDGFLVMDNVAFHLEDFVEKGDYHSAVRSIAHTMRLCQENFYIDAFQFNAYSLSWLNMPLHFVRLRNIISSSNHIDRFVSILQLISMLDFSLSHLLVDEAGRTPKNLTAALDDPRLISFLNAPTRSILKILFGPMTSLNLHTLFWQGFVSPSDFENEIPVCLLYFLFALVLSIDEQLLSTLDKPVVVQSKLSECLTAFSSELLPSDSYSPFLREPENVNPVFLKPFVNLFMTRRYFDAACLGVLCIASVLRNEFCRVINWPEGVLAPEDKIFLTLNVILQMRPHKSIPKPIRLEEWKKFEQCIGPINLLLLGGVFSAEGGPRLRRRLAHGELFEKSISDCVIWEGIARRLKFCIFLLLNHMRGGNTALIIRDLDVRPDIFNPLAHYAVAACELWSAWASFFRVVAEVNPLPQPRQLLLRRAQLWFPELPKWDDISLHSIEDASKFLPTVDISRLWLWKVQYVCNRDVSRHDGNHSPFRVAQRLVGILQDLATCYKFAFDQYSIFSSFSGRNQNEVDSAVRYCKVIVPQLLAVLSIPVLCCCHKAGIWNTWFAGCFIANESDAIGLSNLPKNNHVLLNEFDIFGNNLISVLKTKSNQSIKDTLHKFVVPTP